MRRDGLGVEACPMPRECYPRPSGGQGWPGAVDARASGRCEGGKEPQDWVPGTPGNWKAGKLESWRSGQPPSFPDSQFPSSPVPQFPGEVAPPWAVRRHPDLRSPWLQRNDRCRFLAGLSEHSRYAVSRLMQYIGRDERISLLSDLSVGVSQQFAHCVDRYAVIQR